MNLQEEKVIGIVGGMGPQAGIALLNRIVCHTGATTDQQHLSTVLMSFAGHIADRTSFLEGAVSDNPAFVIAKIIHKLEVAGAKVVGIACNTAHAPRIYDVIVAELNKAKSSVKLLNMPLETCRYIRENHLGVRRIGLMTTNGTCKAGVYENLLREWGYEVVVPDDAFQNEVIHTMIYHPEYGIKSTPHAVSSQVRTLADKALRFFREKKADAVILGCTELPLVITDPVVNNMLIIDATEMLAKALVKESRCVTAGESAAAAINA